MFQFEGQVVIVTGGSSGIGAAAARRFATEGASVIIAARDPQKATAIVSEIRSAGGAASFIQTDVRQEEQLAACVQETLGRHGRIDVVFNNAGSGWHGSWSESSESLHEMLETTVTATWRMCKLVVPQMEAQGSGAIVNMSSILALGGTLEGYNPLHGIVLSYGASKGAIESYTRALAVEVGPLNVRVNCVRPGWIPTPLTAAGRRRTEEVTKPFFASRQALHASGQPEDVAEAVLFLASSHARFITGQVLGVDGGYTLT
jgi:NAD(P)-dependent dehydrogenase (short-subunit alcohol dehydrogenase family)